MLDEGFDPGVAQERVKGQGCEPVGIIEGPCGYPTRLVGTQGKTRFLGRPWAKVCRIGVLVVSGSAWLPEPGAKPRGATLWVL